MMFLLRDPFLLVSCHWLPPTPVCFSLLSPLYSLLYSLYTTLLYTESVSPYLFSNFFLFFWFVFLSFWDLLLAECVKGMDWGVVFLTRPLTHIPSSDSTFVGA